MKQLTPRSQSVHGYDLEGRFGQLGELTERLSSERRDELKNALLTEHRVELKNALLTEHKGGSSA